MNEAMFDLPDAGFVDRTVTHLMGTSPSGADVLLVVERRPLPAAKSLRQIADDHAKDAMTRHFAYKVIFDREIEVGSHPVIDVGASFRTGEGEAVYTRRAHLTLGSTWLLITGETSSAESELCDAYFDHVLASLQIRE